MIFAKFVTCFSAPDFFLKPTRDLFRLVQVFVFIST